MPTPDLAGVLRRPPAEQHPVAPPGVRDVPAHATDSPPGNTRDEKGLEPATRRARRAATDPPATPAPQKESPPRAVPVRQYLRSIAVYLPRSVHRQLRAEAAARATTATALMLAAVNGTHDRIADALTQTEADEDGEHEHGLFDIPQARRPSEPTVQTTIRVTDSQHQALAELAGTLGANRSQLIAAALRLYLG